MARVDDYINAKKLAVSQLATLNYQEIADRTGFFRDTDDSYRIQFLNRTYRVTLPEFDFSDTQALDGSGPIEIPLQEQVLILHYMMAQAPVTPWGKWVAYREIPGASFYFEPFTKRAVVPLKNIFGNNLVGFKTAAEKLCGKPISEGDAGFEFLVFPKIPIRLILWEGDEEFAAEGTILFDESIGQLLSAEDVAWLAGMLVYRLAALSK
ncbi:MAG: DUF3786 domain-containing protein [Desulfobacterales bacterium]|jgi:hypothetical protein|nr:DUF3786 domain-containing protein [Desulfobacterales bacterium]